MNVEQYNINPELVTSLVIVGALLLAYCVFSLTRQAQDKREGEHYSPVDQDPTPHVSAGQLWYTRTGNFEPFINVEVEPVKILEFRKNGFDGWVRYEVEGVTTIARLSDFVVTHMTDEFGDIKPAPVPVVEKKPDLDIEVELEETPEEPVIPSKNVVNIDGKEFVLTPVKS